VSVFFVRHTSCSTYGLSSGFFPNRKLANKDFGIVMRSAVSSLLVPLLCLALLGSLPSFQSIDGRPEMLGADRLELGDVVRLARGLTAEEGDFFPRNFRNAVLALEALINSDSLLLSANEEDPSTLPIFVFSWDTPTPPILIYSSSVCPVPSGFFSHFAKIDTPPPKDCVFKV
jgi:hypothetical protein